MLDDNLSNNEEISGANVVPFTSLKNRKIHLMKRNHNPEEIWQTKIDKLKSIFPELTDDDFKYDFNSREVMMNELQSKLKRSREELNSILTGL